MGGGSYFNCPNLVTAVFCALVAWIRWMPSDSNILGGFQRVAQSASGMLSPWVKTLISISQSSGCQMALAPKKSPSRSAFFMS